MWTSHQSLTILCKDAFWSDTDAFWYWKPLTLIPVLKFKHSTPSLTWKKKIKRKEHTPTTNCSVVAWKQIITKQSLKHTENVDKSYSSVLCMLLCLFFLPLTSCMWKTCFCLPVFWLFVIIFEGLQTGVLSIQSCHIKQQAKPLLQILF